MAALTDGTEAGTIPASPVVPVPATAPTATPSTNAPASSPVAPARPVSTVSSKTAADLVTNKIAPTLSTASADIAANNARSASVANGYVYNVPDGKGGYYSGPASGAPSANPTPGSTTPASDASSSSKTSTATTNPDAGYKYAYDPVTGAQSQIPVEDNAADYGLSPTNPKAPPSTPLSSNNPIQDTVGNTYKTYTDGTYGKFDVAGNYIGPASAQEVQEAETSSGLLKSLGQLANGTYPLTPDQQAQVNGLTAQYLQLIEQQKTANANLTGGTTVAMNLYGMGNSLTGLGAIRATVDSGIQKIATLDSEMVAAVAKMKTGFQTDNYNLMKGAYDTYNKSQKDKQDELDKLTKAAQDAAATALKNKQTIDQYNLDVKKFNETKDQNAFDNALKTEQAAEARRHDKATEAIDAYKAGMGAGGGTGAVGGITASASYGANGTVDPTSQKAVLDQITTKYGPMTATAIKSLADYSMNPTDWSTRAGTKGLSRAEAVTLAKMYDPTYNDAQFSVREGYMKSLASTSSGSAGAAINSANKAVNHLTAFVTTIGKVANGPSSTLNAAVNSIEITPKRRANLSAAKTEALGVADELAKFFKGTGSTDVESINSWKAQVSANASPSDVKGLTQGAIDLLAGQLQTLSEQYTTIMGKPPANNFLSPSAMASLSSLKNQGYTVDVPGVIYTDKNAYVAHDPSAVSNMAAATKQLQDAGLPLTAENILQLAQSQ